MRKTNTSRSYPELITLHTFEERYEYLSLKARIGEETFGFERWMNQDFYRSKEWKEIRREVILRDGACDLGIPGFDIHARAIIHHIIQMTVEDLEEGNPLVLDPDNLITTTQNTHNAIHWGDKSLLVLPPVERRPGDTTLWSSARRLR